jgi:predicted molibdopterin-dependent oxidoreductase YjgC
MMGVSGRALTRIIRTLRFSRAAASTILMARALPPTRTACRPRTPTTTIRSSSPRAVSSQFLSGSQTRRIGPLVAQYPEPKVEMHPRLAERLGVRDGERVRVVSRRGNVELAAHVVATIRPDTVFIPYHWPGAQSANRLTLRAYDPVAKIPEFKVAAVRIERLVAEGA